MNTLTPAQLLDIWETGRARPPFERALILLQAAMPAVEPDQLAALPIGRRDGLLLALRAALFGQTLQGIVGCPVCSAPLEMSLATEDLLALETAHASTQALVLGQYSIVCRPPTTADVAATASDSIEQASAALLARCILAVSLNGEPVHVTALPEPLVGEVVQHIAAADPLADLQFALECPACNHRWQSTFDVVSFFWRELEHWTRRLLREVHVLASAYGWREADILALSPWRRTHYLELIAERGIR